MADRPATTDDEITYALIHGGGDVGWVWHLVEAELQQRGRRTVAIDLPLGPDTGLQEQASAVIDAVGDAPRVVVVCHSFGGFTGPMVAEALPAAFLLVLVAAMVPRPGEAPDDWWSATGYAASVDGDAQAEDLETFYQDVDPAQARDAASRGRDGSLGGLDEPWPLLAWPTVPTRYVLFRQDRFFPAPFLRAMVRDRLGIECDELDGGHCAMLSRPQELAAYLEQALADALGADATADASR